MQKKLISIILPIYNEEKNIPLIYQDIITVMDTVAYDYELIFINDGSSDHSWEILLDLAFQDNRVRAFSFSRNFGHQIALTAGYDYARGDAIITMDADRQHPAHYIPHLIQKWYDGNYIVYIRNKQRNDHFLKKITAHFFYRVLNHITNITIPQHVQDFRLIDKKVLEIIKQSREKSRYLRGMVAWTGFNYTIIDAEYQMRAHGKTGYSWKKMLQLAGNGLTNFSLFPLRLAGFIGVFIIMTGCCMFCYITIDACIYHIHYPLFKWLVTAIYIFIGLLFILLWFIGEYVGRIYEELKNRPLYIIADRYDQSHLPFPTNSIKKNISTVLHEERKYQ